jgi:hypothetical protein
MDISAVAVCTIYTKVRQVTGWNLATSAIFGLVNSRAAAGLAHCYPDCMGSKAQLLS